MIPFRLRPSTAAGRRLSIVAAAVLLSAAACGQTGGPLPASSGISTPAATGSSPTVAPTTLVLPSSPPSSAASTNASTTASDLAPTSTAAPLNIAAVDWRSVSVPGAVCGASQPIALQAGTASIPTPAGLGAGTSQVEATEGAVDYGTLVPGAAEIAAVNVWCTNAGGTAAGQLKDSWVMYSAASGTLQVLAVLVPQQPANADPVHVPYFDTSAGGINIQPGSVTVRELWYGPGDADCCPSVKATTVWRYAGGSFTPATTVG